MILVHYSTVERFFARTKKFKTLKGAQKYAQKMLGQHPDISETFKYAVSMFGTSKIEVSGTKPDGTEASLADLFPAP